MLADILLLKQRDIEIENCVQESLRKDTVHCKSIVAKHLAHIEIVQGGLISISSEVNGYCHFGINCNKLMSNSETIKSCCDKLRKTFLKNGVNPITAKRIYECKVLPCALYGTELLFETTSTELLPLERAHRQCIKWMQGISNYTRTDLALGCLGIHPIEKKY